MKQLLFLILIFFSAKCYSQSLEGEWKGNFEIVSTNKKYSYEPTSIKLKFVRTANNLYDVFSYTYDILDGSLLAVCKVDYKLIGSDSIYLEEKEFVGKTFKPNCFQKMTMKIIAKKNVTVLQGTWEYVQNDCGNFSGKVHLKKKPAFHFEH